MAEYQRLDGAAKRRLNSDGVVKKKRRADGSVSVYLYCNLEWHCTTCKLHHILEIELQGLEAPVSKLLSGTLHGFADVWSSCIRRVALRLGVHVIASI